MTAFASLLVWIGRLRSSSCPRSNQSRASSTIGKSQLIKGEITGAQNPYTSKELWRAP